MLKSVNMPILKNQQCNMSSDDVGFFDGKNKFYNLPDGYKIIINEQDVVVRKSKRVEYTQSKLYENKRVA